MKRFDIGLVAILMLSCLGRADAGDRYFIYDGSAGRYCDQPTTYTENCYVVRDEPNVVRVNGYPVMHSSRANALCHEPAVVAKPSDCCGTSPSSDQCLPHLLKRCRCPGKPTNTPIGGKTGRLQEKCDKEYFYKTICEIQGTIPVPIICVTATEKYEFRPKTLDFDCDDPAAPGEGCEDVECDHSDCQGPCRVASCEVYNKKEYCEKRCELCPREEKLLLAVRRDGKTADVFIGRVGANSFPEYPTNLAVIRNRSEAAIRTLLRNPNISFKNCEGGPKDLIPLL